MVTSNTSSEPKNGLALVATDFSEPSKAAVLAALQLRKPLGLSKIELTRIIGEIDYASLVPPAIPPASRSIAKERMEALAQTQLDQLTGSNEGVSNHVGFGFPPRELAKRANNLKADLIISGSSGHGAISRVVMGSVSSQLIRYSEVPVLVVRPEQRENLIRPKRILAAVDLSPVSKQVIDNAVWFAQREAEVTVLSAFEDWTLTPYAYDLLPPNLLSIKDYEEAEKLHREHVEKLIADTDAGPVTVTPQILAKSKPANAILQQAESEKSDLIVIGRSGHNAVERFLLGSTATRVAGDAECSVLVIP